MRRVLTPARQAPLISVLAQPVRQQRAAKVPAGTDPARYRALFSAGLQATVDLRYHLPLDPSGGRLLVLHTEPGAWRSPACDRAARTEPVIARARRTPSHP